MFSQRLPRLCGEQLRTGSRFIEITGNFHSKSPHPERNRIAWLKLKLVPGLGNRSVLNLLEVFGSPENILAAGLKGLTAAGVAREAALHALAAKRFIRDPDAEWAKLKAQNVRLLCLGDADYPSNLAGIPDPPAVLFTSGAVEPRDLVSIAVVGSRYASPAGLIFTEKLCSDLALSGVTVVSGFAVGIDSAAHRGAIKANGRTLAVLGCGLDVNYPSINADLKREIDASGAILTEFGLGTPPAPGNFPARNRIISGLSLGVVVVEAAEKSGSLITARYALEQGREVFAVPGVAGSLRSTGTHRLLKQGAKLAEGVEDILEEIRPLIRTGKGPVPQPPLDRPPVRAESCPREESILLRIMDKVPKHIDEIAHDAGVPVQQAAAMLLALELRGLVSQLPGKYFICS
ncbi:MAG: DNA-processing protein DprA [Syntrophobacteraceae bacterium]